MKTAEELFQEYWKSISDPAKVANLFAEDGAIEMPYLKSLGGSDRWQGKENVQKLAEGLLSQAPDFKFSNAKVLIATPDHAFAEYSVETLFNGKPYKQLYMGRLVAKDGKIQLLREGCDVIAIANLRK